MDGDALSQSAATALASAAARRASGGATTAGATAGATSGTRTNADDKSTTEQQEHRTPLPPAPSVAGEPSHGPSSSKRGATSWPPGGRIEIRWGSAASRGARASMEDAHVGVVDVCEHFGVELCSGCGVGRGVEGGRGSSEASTTTTATTSTSTTGEGFASGVGLSFFGVFDGHGGGGAAAAFAASRLLDLVVERGREALASDPAEAMTRAFERLDLEFYRHASEVEREKREEEMARSRAEEGGRAEGASRRDGDDDGGPSSFSLHDCGSTALAALLCGSTLVLANAGDSRAVLCSRRENRERDSLNGCNDDEGFDAAAATTTTPLPPSFPSSSTSTFRQLTVDHKPSCATERARIEAAGGRVCPEGFLNSCLGVARAIGDYSRDDGLKWLLDDGGDDSGPTTRRLVGPLTATPDVSVFRVTPRDEFLLVACDGLWDVLPTARAVELARQHLRSENGDPTKAAAALVRYAIKELHASDNVTALLLCFGPAAVDSQEEKEEGDDGGDVRRCCSCEQGEGEGEKLNGNGADDERDHLRHLHHHHRRRQHAASCPAAAASANAPLLHRASPRQHSSSSFPSSALGSNSGRPARSLSRSSLSTLSDALASCVQGERGGGGRMTSSLPTTTTTAAALLPCLTPPLSSSPPVVVVAGGGTAAAAAGERRNGTGATAAVAGRPSPRSLPDLLLRRASPSTARDDSRLGDGNGAGVVLVVPSSPAFIGGGGSGGISRATSGEGGGVDDRGGGNGSGLGSASGRPPRPRQPQQNSQL